MATRTRSQITAAARRVAEGLTEAGTPLGLPPVVGLKEIARMFGVKHNTANHWRSVTKILPTEDDTISGNPVWKIPTMYAFAESTGKPIIWDPWELAYPAS